MILPAFLLSVTLSGCFFIPPLIDNTPPPSSAVDVSSAAPKPKTGSIKRPVKINTPFVVSNESEFKKKLTFLNYISGDAAEKIINDQYVGVDPNSNQEYAIAVFKFEALKVPRTNFFGYGSTCDEIAIMQKNGTKIESDSLYGDAEVKLNAKYYNDVNFLQPGKQKIYAAFIVDKNQPKYIVYNPGDEQVFFAIP